MKRSLSYDPQSPGGNSSSISRNTKIIKTNSKSLRSHRESSSFKPLNPENPSNEYFIVDDISSTQLFDYSSYSSPTTPKTPKTDSEPSTYRSFRKLKLNQVEKEREIHHIYKEIKSKMNNPSKINIEDVIHEMLTRFEFIPEPLNELIISILKELLENWNNEYTGKYLYTFIQMIYSLPSLMLHPNNYDFTTVSLSQEFLNGILKLYTVEDDDNEEIFNDKTDIVLYDLQNFMNNMKLYESLFQTYRLDIENQIAPLQNDINKINGEINQNQNMLYIFINNLYQRYPTLQNVNPNDITSFLLNQSDQYIDLFQSHKNSLMKIENINKKEVIISKMINILKVIEMLCNKIKEFYSVHNNVHTILSYNKSYFSKILNRFLKKYVELCILHNLDKGDIYKYIESFKDIPMNGLYNDCLVQFEMN